MYNILIIEDDKEINHLLSDFLTQSGYKTLSRYDGGNAAKFVQHNTVDLVLLDIMLPYRSGDMVLADIREFSTIPVIIISAKETTQNKIDLLRLGADDYITKPFDMEEVLARVESTFRRVEYQRPSKGKVKYKDIEIDFEKNMALANEKELPLTSKEFSILKLLVEYPDKIFSKANLFQSVWNEEYLCEDNALSVHISNLRAKIKEYCSEEEYIDTVWGIGYRLHKAEE